MSSRIICRIALNTAVLNGGADRGRTDDLLHAMQALCQLSYSPICVLRYDIIILYCPILSQ